MEGEERKKKKRRTRGEKKNGEGDKRSAECHKLCAVVVYSQLPALVPTAAEGGKGSAKYTRAVVVYSQLQLKRSVLEPRAVANGSAKQKQDAKKKGIATR